MLGGTGADILLGGDGDDYLEGDDVQAMKLASMAVIISMGALGTINCMAEAEMMYSSGVRIAIFLLATPTQHQNDSLGMPETRGNDVLDGGSGDDELDGLYGDDLLLGGAGNDLVNGQDGSDVLDGGNGDDTLSGDLRIVALGGRYDARRVSGGRKRGCAIREGR